MLCHTYWPSLAAMCKWKDCILPKIFRIELTLLKSLLKVDCFVVCICVISTIWWTMHDTCLHYYHQHQVSNHRGYLHADHSNSSQWRITGLVYLFISALNLCRAYLRNAWSYDHEIFHEDASRSWHDPNFISSWSFMRDVM